MWKPGRVHRRRYHETGHARYLTFSCFHNRPFLRSERCCRWLLEKLGELHREGGFDLWAYVVMPTHCHMLLLPHNDAAVTNVLYRLKKAVANRAIAWIRLNCPGRLSELEDVQPSGKHSFRFWQRGGGYDRNIFTARELHEKIAYIHANPVRWGLVENPQDWPWSSCRAWECGKDVPLPIDRESLPPLIRV